MQEAVDAGAELTGGGRDGSFFKPGILTGIEKGNPAYGEELFGPVAQVYKVASEEEAVALANDTPYGLGSYLFTTDSEQAMRVADQIEAGMVFVNVVLADGVELPFGGVRPPGSVARWASSAPTSSSTRSSSASAADALARGPLDHRRAGPAAGPPVFPSDQLQIEKLLVAVLRIAAPVLPLRLR